MGVGNIYRRVHGMYRDGEVFICSSEGPGYGRADGLYTADVSGRKDEV
ncbi:MAG: hypothetical protein ACLTW9_24380 [Enterocloster sp.]